MIAASSTARAEETFLGRAETLPACFSRLPQISGPFFAALGHLDAAFATLHQPWQRGV
jgi:hypothetical protein